MGYQSTSGDVDHMAGLDHLRRFEPAILAKRFLSRLQESFRTKVADALQRGRLLDHRETREVAEELSRDALHLILLDELPSLAEELPQIDSDTARNPAEQRDAIAIALESVGLNGAKTMPRTERDDGPNQLPFWNDIRTRPADEAASIRHDWSRMLDLGLTDRGVLAELLGVSSRATGFTADLGLSDKPAMIRLRCARGLLGLPDIVTDLSLRLDEAGRLAPLWITQALIVENEVTYLLTGPEAWSGQPWRVVAGATIQVATYAFLVAGALGHGPAHRLARFTLDAAARSDRKRRARLRA